MAGIELVCQSGTQQLAALSFGKVAGDAMSFLDRAVQSINDSFDWIRGMFGAEVAEELHIEFEAGTVVPPLGILKDMGYYVGKGGLRPSERREILRRTFRVHLVATSPWTKDYIAEWGKRCSLTRFNKIDRVLGGLAARAERKTKVDMSQAIRDWREDQRWLRSMKAEWLTHNHK